MHVVVRENDVNYVKNSFESNFSAKNRNLTMKQLFLTMTIWIFEFLELFIHTNRLLRHTLPINREGRNLPTFSTQLTGGLWLEVDGQFSSRYSSFVSIVGQISLCHRALRVSRKGMILVADWEMDTFSLSSNVWVTPQNLMCFPNGRQG